jgi:hypothetical protein
MTIEEMIKELFPTQQDREAFMSETHIALGVSPQATMGSSLEEQLHDLLVRLLEAQEGIVRSVPPFRER